MLLIAYIVLGLSFLNLLRMAAYMIGADVYDIKSALNKSDERRTKQDIFKIAYQPLVTVIVPAHNEEKTLKRCLESVRDSTYANIELIIVNDSSSDWTPIIAEEFRSKHADRFTDIKVFNLQVRGKAKGLNEALQHTNGELFMCLDADSALAPTSLEAIVREFQDDSLACVASHVKIFDGPGALNLFQQVEYLVCYEMKKSEVISDTQYIVGGIGSVFRTDVVREMGYYDTDTITEDIDLSMKVISAKGRTMKIGYTPDAIVYTEAVNDIPGLLRQRFRWKYGRYQTFLKHADMFLSTKRKYNPLLTWLSLPYALIAEVLFILEPLVITMIFLLIFQYGDYTMLWASLIVFTFYTTIHVSRASEGYSSRERLRFIAFAPAAYLGMFVLSFVEYVASFKGMMSGRKLIREYRDGTGDCEWVPVERRGSADVTA